MAPVSRRPLSGFSLQAFPFGQDVVRWLPLLFRAVSLDPLCQIRSTAQRVLCNQLWPGTFARAEKKRLSPFLKIPASVKIQCSHFLRRYISFSLNSPAYLWVLFEIICPIAGIKFRIPANASEPILKQFAKICPQLGAQLRGKNRKAQLNKNRERSFSLFSYCIPVKHKEYLLTKQIENLRMRDTKSITLPPTLKCFNHKYPSWTEWIESMVNV